MFTVSSKLVCCWFLSVITRLPTHTLSSSPLTASTASQVRSPLGVITWSLAFSLACLLLEEKLGVWGLVFTPAIKPRSLGFGLWRDVVTKKPKHISGLVSPKLFFLEGALRRGCSYI